jgi:hypothetical protein
MDEGTHLVGKGKWMRDGRGNGMPVSEHTWMVRRGSGTLPYLIYTVER